VSVAGGRFAAEEKQNQAKTHSRKQGEAFAHGRLAEWQEVGGIHSEPKVS